MARPGVNAADRRVAVSVHRGRVQAPPTAVATDGVLAEGSFTAANLTGALAGQPLSALIAAMETGNAYLNVHTNDGVAPTNTGPGDFPGGEIRGDIR